MSPLDVRSIVFAAALSAAAAVGSAAHAVEKPTNPWNNNASPGLAALAAAADQGRYAFVLFWKENDDATHRMQTALQDGMKQLPRPAEVVGVCLADSREAATVEIFGVARAPLPLVAAVAPNGAVTKAWPLKLASGQLAEAIVSRGTAECLKAMQEQKLTLVCVQNAKSTQRAAAKLAVAGFQADERFAAATRVVVIDPADPSEKAFLANLQVSPKTPEAVTVLVSPAGQAIGKFAGAVTTEDLVAKVASAQAGCCPGGQCGPNGCCPGGQCGPAK
ncbi:MAG: hypothetical protein KF688_11785 [Pirellulales bacterium]|nr:hypothetical protein [Pirellulales bacterium]